MSLYSSPPPMWEFRYDKPTLLVCWWATLFCAAIIVLRVAGRFIRTERLFCEDKMAALALVPMFLRMSLVHYILVNGTNNLDYLGVVLSVADLRKKEIASGLVLLARVLYATTLWMLKDSVLEFFRRLTGVTWSRTYEQVLTAIRCTLVATLVAVVISTLAECQPFSHYWQVMPDPGGQCRQGYAQLITLAVCNVLTDLMLVLFPVPIILCTKMPLLRKAQLVMLFSLSLAVVAVTLYRVPNTISRHGRQQYRSLLASIELLFATAATNSLVLGSFVRDRGLKKKKFDFGSVLAAATTNSPLDPTPRRSTVNRHWGSDENLVRDLGIGVQPELRARPDTPSHDSIPLTLFTPAPPVAVLNLDSWAFPSPVAENSHQLHRTQSQLPVDKEATLTDAHRRPSRSNSNISPRRVSAYDVGGLLPTAAESPLPDTSRAMLYTDSGLTVVEPPQPSPPMVSVSSPVLGAWLPSDTSLPVPAPAVVPTSSLGSRRASALRLQDLGGLLLRPVSRSGSTRSPVNRSGPPSRLMTIPQGRPAAIPDPELRDPGDLLR